jgi:hypothetical protein
MTALTNILSYDGGLEPAVLFILSYHIGSARAIGREALVLALVKMGQGAHERAVRECIKQLRRQGHLICSMPGEGGGYYMANTLAEFDEFDHNEFGAKIADMNQTRLAMLKAAHEKFGEAVQLGLI